MTSGTGFALHQGKPSTRDALVLDGLDLITFDVFDTLVTRVVGRPDDVFLVMQLESGGRLPSTFARDRQAAELSARAEAAVRGHEEVTLAEIYEALAAGWGMGAHEAAWAMDLEVEAELRLCRPRADVRDLLEGYLLAGKRVLAVSDMYLPEETIRAILVRCGYSGLAGVVVSSGHRLTKHSGRLFELLAKREGVPPHRWLHVGDNPWADGGSARRLGIRTLATPLPTCVNRPVRDIGERLFDRIGMLVAAAAPQPCDTSRFWQAAATGVAAPIVVGFCHAIRRKAEQTGADRIYFLARDGAVVMDAYQRLFPDDSRDLSYLYASRRSVGLATIDALDDRAIKFLSEGREGLGVPGLLARAGITDKGSVARAAAAAGTTGCRLTKIQAEAALRSCETKILAVCAKERESFLGYLAAEGLMRAGPALLVDVGWRCSIQRGLVRLLAGVEGAADLHGVYVGTKPEAHVGTPAIAASGWLYEAGRPRRSRAVAERCIEIVELLFAAPEHGVVGVMATRSGYAPVRHQVPEEEARIQVARYIGPAVAAACDLLASTATAHAIGDGRALALARLEGFLRSPDRLAAEVVGAIRHSAGFGASCYHPIVMLPASWHSPRDVARCLLRSFWREGLAHAAPRRLRRPLLIATRTFVPAFRLALEARLRIRRALA